MSATHDAIKAVNVDGSPPKGRQLSSESIIDESPWYLYCIWNGWLRGDAIGGEPQQQCYAVTVILALVLTPCCFLYTYMSNTLIGTKVASRFKI